MNSDPLDRVLGGVGTVPAVAMTGGEWLLSLERDGVRVRVHPVELLLAEMILVPRTVVCNHQSGHSDGVSPIQRS